MDELAKEHDTDVINWRALLETRLDEVYIFSCAIVLYNFIRQMQEACGISSSLVSIMLFKIMF